MYNEKPTIMIIEDAVENIDVLYNVLKDEYELKVAKDGIEALELIKKSDLPDLILMDIMMPEMDGYQTTQKLKENTETKDIPIIFLTSKTKAEDIVKGFNLGAVDYVGKPFNTPELLSRVKTQISLKKQKDIIEERSKEQKELLQIMCHDLATHFSIINSCLWLTNNKENAVLDSYKDRIKMATLCGIDIINLVREMRAVEDKKFPLEKINLTKRIYDAIQLHNENLVKKNIKIDVDIPDNLHIIAESRSFVNSVVNNILSNAIKFSYEHSSITISAIKRGDTTTLSFKDYGMGIPDNLMADLFGLQKYTNRLGTSGEKGTGFGMPLIKKFIELYGGEIRVASKDVKKHKKDHGTEILLTLKTG